MTSEEEEEGLMASCHILLRRVDETGLNSSLLLNPEEIDLQMCLKDIRPNQIT